MKGWYVVSTVTLNRILEPGRLRGRIRSSHVQGSLYRVISLSLPLPLPLPSSVSLSLFLSPSPRVSPLLPWKVAFHFHIPFFPFKCYTRSALSYDSSSGRPLVRARARAYALERIACSAFTIRARVKADRKE